MSFVPELTNLLKSGTFGDVYKYQNKAVKKIVLKDEDIMKDAMDEIKILQLLQKNIHIITFINAYVTKTEIYITFEIHGIDLNDYIQLNKDINITSRRNILKQILLALKYLKECKIIHQDLKSRNVLIKGTEVKLCDFGSAQIVPNNVNFMEIPDYYVCTLTYRAPELLMNDKYYNYQIDMWSFGIIMLELHNDIKELHDIVLSDIPEKQSEVKIMEWIMQRFDKPTEESWPGYHNLFRRRNVKPHMKLNTFFKEYPEDEYDLIKKILTWPKIRIKVKDALNHKFFSGCNCD